MNTKIEKVQYAQLLNDGLTALHFAEGLKKYPIAGEIANARLGTIHTIAYKSFSKDVPGLVTYKKIRMRLTKYAAQKAVKEAWSSGTLKKTDRVDNRVYFKNNLAYNIKTGKFTFSFVPYEKLQEKFVFNGFEISPEKAHEMIEKARQGKPKRPAPLIPWRTVELSNIIAFN